MNDRKGDSEGKGHGWIWSNMKKETHRRFVRSVSVYCRQRQPLFNVCMHNNSIAHDIHDGAVGGARVEQV